MPPTACSLVHRLSAYALPSSLSLPTPSFAFRLHHTPFAIGQPFGSCQIVSCGCHTLRISNAPYAALPLAARCSDCPSAPSPPLPIAVLVVGCFVSSVNVYVCVYVCVCVCMRVCVFNYKMSDMLKIKFTARLILLILVHSLSLSPSLPYLTFA